MKKFLQIVGGIFVLVVIIGVVAGHKSSSSNSNTISLPPATSTAAPAAATTTVSEPGPFNGNGTENLGTINVPNNTVLKWSCAACGGANGNNFIVGNNPNDANQIDVNGLDVAAGQTVVDGGTYHDVQVLTEANGWTITFTQGS